jgi:hypothetical protein
MDPPGYARFIHGDSDTPESAGPSIFGIAPYLHFLTFRNIFKSITKTAKNNYLLGEKNYIPLYVVLLEGLPGMHRE